MSHEVAVREVSKSIFSKWYHDTVYTIPLNGIQRKVVSVWQMFKESRKCFGEGRQSGKAIDDLKKLVDDINKLKHRLPSVKRTGE